MIAADIGRNVSANNFITVITGLPRSGKSTLLKNKIIPEYLQQGKRVLIIDVNKEYKAAYGLDVFRIRNYGDAEREAEELIQYILKHNIYDVLIVDESNVIFNKTRLLPNTRKLINTLRHEKIDFIAVARRPVDVNITISELAQRRCIFRTGGYNDISRLNSYKAGLGDAAAALGEHDYIIIDNDFDIKTIKA